MITKRGLGRGLGALLSSEPTEAEALVDVPIDQVEVNPNQPRKVFDFTALDELAASSEEAPVIKLANHRPSGRRRLSAHCG